MPGLNGVPPARDLHLGRCRTLRGRLRAMRSATTPPRPLRPALYRREPVRPRCPPSDPYPAANYPQSGRR